MDRRAFLMAAPSAILAGKAFAIGKSPLPVVPYGPSYHDIPEHIRHTAADPRVTVRISTAAKRMMKHIPYSIDNCRLSHLHANEMISLYENAVESVVGFRGPFIISSDAGDMTHWGCCDYPYFEVLDGYAKIPARRIEISDKLLESFGEPSPKTKNWDPKNDYWALFSYLDMTEYYKKVALDFNGRKKTA